MFNAWNKKPNHLHISCRPVSVKSGYTATSTFIPIMSRMSGESIKFAISARSRQQRANCTWQPAINTKKTLHKTESYNYCRGGIGLSCLSVEKLFVSLTLRGRLLPLLPASIWFVLSSTAVEKKYYNILEFWDWDFDCRSQLPFLSFQKLWAGICTEIRYDYHFCSEDRALPAT